jgi:Flp pilus assembly protein TadD
MMPTRRERIQAMLIESPDDPELHYMLAMEHVSAGDDAGALQVFAKLAAIAPDNVAGYHQSARALQRLDRIGEARTILEKAIPIALRQGNQHAAGEMQGLLETLD